MTFIPYNLGTNIKNYDINNLYSSNSWKIILLPIDFLGYTILSYTPSYASHVSCISLDNEDWWHKWYNING